MAYSIKNMAYGKNEMEHAVIVNEINLIRLSKWHVYVCV